MKNKKSLFVFVIFILLASLIAPSFITYSSETKDLIYEDSFVDNQPNPLAIFRFGAWHKFENEQLYMGYNTNTNEWGNSAEAYIANQRLDFDGQNTKYEYEITFSSNRSYSSLWSAAMIGIRIQGNDKNGFKPADDDAGLYLALASTNQATVYHTKSNWTSGAFTFNLPANFSTTNTLTIVDDQGLVDYFINTENEGRVHILQIDLRGDTLYAYGSDSQELYQASNNLKDKTGYFKIFNHDAKTIVDSIKIFSVKENASLINHAGSQIRKTLVPYLNSSKELENDKMRQGLRFSFELDDVDAIITYNSEQYTVIGNGALIALSSNVIDPEEMIIGGNVYKMVNQTSLIDWEENGITYKSAYIYNISEFYKDEVISVRPYLECKDSSDNIVYVYGDIVSDSLSTVFSRLTPAEISSLSQNAKSWWM